MATGTINHKTGFIFTCPQKSHARPFTLESDTKKEYENNR